MNKDKRPKIVFMEAQSLGDDMDLSAFDKLGDVTVYDVDTPAENAIRIKEADIAIMNKIKMDDFKGCKKSQAYLYNCDRN